MAPPPNKRCLTRVGAWKRRRGVQRSAPPKVQSCYRQQCWYQLAEDNQRWDPTAAPDNAAQHIHFQHIICLICLQVRLHDAQNFVALPFLTVLLLPEIEEPGRKQSNLWHIIVAAHLSQNFIHCTDTDVHFCTRVPHHCC